ncbi:conserved hypothetical protein [Rubrivivax sp. A210]|uniref:DUF3563 family protein n=1 Tax=Rubrivivax sp. A210 TaxID=2772301 RepID=UPI00191B4660|nr:DUF3563 family protein [Rubrivivax sp. A210]CAD5374286.1 conserved hypothetical protein [Rubrivivax sp. A210]
MSSLMGLIKALIPHIESQQERDEAFLAGAVDRCDLERRMREVDGHGRDHARALALGIGRH